MLTLLVSREINSMQQLYSLLLKETRILQC
jgi:hypothetical protein